MTDAITVNKARLEEVISNASTFLNLEGNGLISWERYESITHVTEKEVQKLFSFIQKGDDEKIEVDSSLLLDAIRDSKYMDQAIDMGIYEWRFYDEDFAPTDTDIKNSLEEMVIE